MAKQTRDQKNLIILAAAAVLIIGGFLIFSSRDSQVTQQYSVATPAPINSSSELNSVSKDLDNLDLNQIDKELENLNLDTLDF